MSTRCKAAKIDAHVVARLRAEAVKKTPFVLTVNRSGAEPVFVFVATDLGSMQGLIDRFATLDAPVADVWR
jgi:hypothetical protein